MLVLLLRRRVNRHLRGHLGCHGGGWHRRGNVCLGGVDVAVVDEVDDGGARRVGLIWPDERVGALAARLGEALRSATRTDYVGKQDLVEFFVLEGAGAEGASEGFFLRQSQSTAPRESWMDLELRTWRCRAQASSEAVTVRPLGS